VTIHPGTSRAWRFEDDDADLLKPPRPSWGALLVVVACVVGVCLLCAV